VPAVSVDVAPGRSLAAPQRDHIGTPSVCQLHSEPDRHNGIFSFCFSVAPGKRVAVEARHHRGNACLCRVAVEGKCGNFELPAKGWLHPVAFKDFTRNC
jgi:hypothetical protein